MAEEDKPIASLIERQGMGLDPEEIDAVEIEALVSDVPVDIPEDIEIVEEDDGGVTLDFDPMSGSRIRKLLRQPSRRYE